MAAKKTITPTGKVKKALVNREQLLKEENLTNSLKEARERKTTFVK